MPTSSAGTTDVQGRVQWILPPPKNKRPTTTTNLSKTQNRFRYDSQSSNQSSSPSSETSPGINRDFLVLQPNEATNIQQDQQRVSIDDAICKTVCNIVEEYLKELQDHQRHINEARSRLARDVAHDNNYISHNDIYGLKVRDEQTKATETIKQLTNYLRELSSMKRQMDASSDLASEDINNRLSDVRNDIIQALNDFVIANNDIDIPIVYPGESNVRDYDFCTDVHRSTSDISKIEVSQTSTSSPERSSTPASTTAKASPIYSSSGRNRKQSMLISIDESDDGLRDHQMSGDNQQLQTYDASGERFVELEKRKRDIQKLERDTVELRKLFADFYNLVKIQGEHVDSIEDNLVIAAQHISEGKQHLSRSMKGLTVLVPVTGCITGALIGGPIGLIIGSKLGGVTIICATSLLGLLSSIGAHRCIAGNKISKHD